MSLQKLPTNSRLIVVSNRLPFYRIKTETGQIIWKKATGGLVTALDPVLRYTNGIWLGWDGISDETHDHQINLMDVGQIAPDEESLEVIKKSYSIGNIPINQEEIDGYYNHFSNGILWSLFHYFFEKCNLDHKSWETYCKVNERFANYVVAASSPQDLIWVQDFHLLLVPLYLRKLRPKQKIHLFLHIPFPHIDIFSIIPWQKQFLDSLLSCNSVGFHHRNYMRNALEAINMHIRDQKKEGDLSNTFNPQTHFYVNPISINFESFDKTSRISSVLERKDEIKRQCGAPKLVLGVDRLDYSKGIKERLLGIEHLLEQRPELKATFCYYQLAVPSREEVPAYQVIKREVDEIIGRINGKFSTGTWYPIHYIYNTVNFNELIALYSSADIALVTPLRDGMNLVCKEYIASHSDEDGVLILSQFAGASAEIKNCLYVNPYSIEDISKTLHRALTMPEKERCERMRRMRRNIETHNIENWLNNCLEQFNKS